MQGDGVDHENNAPASPHEGRWIVEGGRLRWIPAYETVDEEDGAPDAFGDTLATFDEAAWASDTPPLPPGAPEPALVRATLAWLNRQRDENRALADEMALLERQRQREREEETLSPRRRRQLEPPSAAALDMARYDGAANWFEIAADALLEQADRTPGRALVEWYLWLITDEAPDVSADDPIAIAGAQGREAAREHARKHAERLTAPESDDE
jgi:hypothetical protein